MTAQNRKEWEASLVRDAAYFTCSIPSTDPRPRGHRLQWNVANHATLEAAVAAARGNPRALIYAVNKGGDSAPLSVAEATRYLEEMS